MITLDIEDTAIKMMVVEGKRVVRAASLPLEFGLIKDGLILNKTAVSQRIVELLTAYSVTEKQVIANISGMHSLYRIFSLPRLPKTMLDEAVRRQMAKVIPVPLNEVYASWQALDVSSAETIICVVGSPRSTVDAVWETLRLAGLRPQLMDVNTLALARLSDEKDAIVVCDQQVGFDIVVMVDGIPRLVRSLSFAAEDASMPDRVKAIKDEIDRTVVFYKSSHEGDLRLRNVPVFLTGQSQQMLAEVLDYPIKQVPAWFDYPEGFDPGGYAVNIGLALKKVRAAGSSSKVSLNVIPEVYLPKPRPRIEIVSWIVILVAIAILVPLLILTSREIAETSALQSRVRDAQVQVDTMEATAAEIKELQTKLDKANDSLDIFQQPISTFGKQRAGVNEDLAKITSLQPGRLKLTSINYDMKGTSILAAGTSPDESLILTYASSLRDTGRFSYVLIKKMTELGFNKWTFILELQ